MTDIVAELRQRHRNTTGLDPRITNPIVGPTIFLEAADEIERLREELTASHESHGNEVGALTERLALAIHERDEARRRTNFILTEIDCRIEHGAESNGHLEVLHDMFKENNDE